MFFPVERYKSPEKKIKTATHRFPIFHKLNEEKTKGNSLRFHFHHFYLISFGIQTEHYFLPFPPRLLGNQTKSEQNPTNKRAKHTKRTTKPTNVNTYMSIYEEIEVRV
jgi:hypothetical protein